MQEIQHVSDYTLGMNYLILTAVSLACGIVVAGPLVEVRRISGTAMLFVWSCVASLLTAWATVSIAENGFFDFVVTGGFPRPLVRATGARVAVAVWIVLLPAVVAEARARTSGLRDGFRDVLRSIGVAVIAAAVAFGPLWLLFMFATGNTIS